MLTNEWIEANAELSYAQHRLLRFRQTGTRGYQWVARYWLAQCVELRRLIASL